MPVPDSLYPFLAMALEGDSESWWWVDSLCIDQHNNLEKAQQVRMMGEVYESAEDTFVWLGEQSEDSDKAMAFLHYLGKEFWYESRWSPTGQRFSWLDNFASRNGEYSSDWSALERFFQRPW